MDYSLFKAQLEVSPILSFAAVPIAISLPILEFLVVIFLAIPKWRLKGLYSSLTLMTTFTVYIIAMFAVSPKMPCSCGGIIELLSWQQHIIFNSLFVLLNLWAIILLRKEKKEFGKDWNNITEYNVSHS